MNKNLISKIGIYFLGNLSSKIFSTLLVPIYAFYIAASDLGEFDFYQTLMSILSPIILLAVWEAILKFILPEKDTYKKKIAINTAIIFTLSISIFVLITGLILLQLLNMNNSINLLVLVMIVLSSCVAVWQYFARALRYNKVFAISGILSAAINFILIVLLVVVFDMGLLGLLISYVGGQLANLLVIEINIRIIKEIEFKYFSFVKLKEMLAFSSPLVLNIVSAWFLSGYSRLILKIKVGSTENGIYTFANKFSMIITMLGTVITMALVEELIEKSNGNKLSKDFSYLIENIFKMFLIISIIGFPMIRTFYFFLGNTEYIDSLYYVPLLLLGAVVNIMASNVGTAFQALSLTRYQFLTTLIGGLSTVVVSSLFITQFGILAVVSAQFLGSIVMLVSRLYFINRRQPVNLRFTKIILLACIYIFISSISIKLCLVGNILLMISLITIYVYINKKKLLKLFRRS
ncbi:oligosaccharide flippase family protein [Vagococcus lutrae]|uniref:lipopolysaccharide biosynthesis protein n=1 Tax=Vagococcus lutrae TaxID=81947 RepID=UPI002A808AA5|nr:oligosaccharide flippase family protein [Vagococcus lutrae]MDY3706230.1 oligosaccharide flippase family protein [Vagococcus lutrae]